MKKRKTINPFQALMVLIILGVIVFFQAMTSMDKSQYITEACTAEGSSASEYIMALEKSEDDSGD